MLAHPIARSECGPSSTTATTGAGIVTVAAMRSARLVYVTPATLLGLNEEQRKFFRIARESSMFGIVPKPNSSEQSLAFCFPVSSCHCYGEPMTLQVVEESGPILHARLLDCGRLRRQRPGRLSKQVATALEETGCVRLSNAFAPDYLGALERRARRCLQRGAHRTRQGRSACSRHWG